MTRFGFLGAILLASVMMTASASAQQWLASWTAAAHGPYPIGNPTAQPELKFAFPSAEQGARNQTMRMIVKPDVWGPQTRIRLSNAFGTKPVTFIGGNQVVGPAEYTPAKPIPGGPSALSRMDRDIVSLPGVSVVIWLEGINDFGAANATAESVIEGFTRGAAHLRQKMPGVRIYVATLTSALNSTPTHGRPEVDAKRKVLNEFLRTSKLFDGVIDFDKATLDGATGEVKAEFQPNSSTGGPGDKLHPNRAGYAAMGEAISLPMITGRAK